MKKFCRFHINLSLGSGTDQKVGIALHINPRWDDGKPVVVRNSYLKNRWGSEERWGEFFPLTAGQNFECIILVQSDCYKVNAKLDRVATAQGKQGIWFLLFPDRENTGNFVITQGKFLRHRENILTVFIDVNSMFLFTYFQNFLASLRSA